MSAVEAENRFAGQGSVLLDIGGDVGALVVSMPRSTLGVEVEARRHGISGHVHHPHVAVVERPTGSGPVPSLVFAELGEGRYDLCRKESQEVHLTATVHGGEVTVLDWPEEVGSPSRG